jgi:hypothetical protein
MTQPMHRDDTSLQGWGRKTLPLIGETLTELVQARAKTVAEDQALADALKKIASQGEDGTLPASPPLAAEVGAIAAEAQKIAADEEALQNRRAALKGRAEVLPNMYRREHETDEDRLDSPRHNRAAEKRADVTAAEQDT